MTIGQLSNIADIGKRTYSVAEIQSILGIGRRQAYELCQTNLFKVIRVGRTVRVSKLSFDNWLDHNEEIGGQ